MEDISYSRCKTASPVEDVGTKSLLPEDAAILVLCVEVLEELVDHLAGVVLVGDQPLPVLGIQAFHFLLGVAWRKLDYR